MIKCKKSEDTCKNRGFVDHKCNCYCPEGLKGDDCNTIASNDCGGIIDLVPGKKVEITSPNYPNNYDVGKICYWLLRVSTKHKPDSND
ncbi:hypothetical protein KUTeg_024135 [Tegillarca granosa]|uniref:CUB domain-containing protein n=1 Tax=Tegillarca granosa TaxID=220873 RepID=A0ABQ9DWG5_TEGGR|nr:hypothetical protein KUTeg_024135 [Tegillarca granosa]